MTEFTINRERQKIHITEERPTDGTIQIGYLQRVISEFAKKHPITEDAVHLRFLDDGDDDGSRMVVILHADRDETDDEMSARIERETYDADCGMKNAFAMKRLRRADDLHILSLLVKRLGMDTVRDALDGKLAETSRP
jgi:hypothetical protein